MMQKHIKNLGFKAGRVTYSWMVMDEFFFAENFTEILKLLLAVFQKVMDV